MIVHPDTWMGHHIAGRDPGDIDEWVERWNAGGSFQELPTFLGMTDEEYENWVLAPEALKHIIRTRVMVEAAKLSLTAAVARNRSSN